MIHRETDVWKRISLDDYGGKITLSAEVLSMLAAVVISNEFTLIAGL